MQPFRLVLFVEKPAVEHVALPLAERYGIDTYLMGGESSDTRLYEMAKRGWEDGRPMVVMALSDCDPAGYWMPALALRVAKGIVRTAGDQRLGTLATATRRASAARRAAGRSAITRTAAAGDR